MGSFLRRWWRLLAAAALMAGVVQIFLRPPASLREFAPLKGFGAGVYRPVAAAADGVRRAVSSVWNGYIALTGVARENEKLRGEVALLREAIGRDREALLENRRLKDLLGFSETVTPRTIGARVVGHDVSPWFNGIFIDQGSESGIEPGMAVVTPGGAVGRVHRTYRGLSVVLLLTDGRFAADVIVERSRARAVAEGAGGRLCSLKYVSPTQDIVPGDRVLFSGFDGSMPKGVLLGTVVSVDRPKESLFQKVKVQCAVNFLEAEEVMVILSRPAIPYRSGRE